MGTSHKGQTTRSSPIAGTKNERQIRCYYTYFFINCFSFIGWEYQDPSIHFKVDIGLPPPKISKSALMKERMKIMKTLRQDPHMEKLSRTKQCEL